MVNYYRTLKHNEEMVMTTPLRYSVQVFTDDGVVHVSCHKLWEHFDRRGSNVMLDVDEAIRTYIADTTEQNNDNTNASQNPADTGQAQ